MIILKNGRVGYNVIGVYYIDGYFLNFCFKGENIVDIWNNLNRGGMRSKKVHFSPFGIIFNLKLTQFNIISPRASGAK